jgi:hypothetical protein
MTKSESGMVPLKPKPGEHSSIEKLVTRALWNCTQFDSLAFMNWLDTKSASIKRLAARCPPNRVYRHEGQYVYILGYNNDRVVVGALGALSGSGVPAEELEDVTTEEKAKRGIRD